MFSDKHVDTKENSTNNQTSESKTITITSDECVKRVNKIKQEFKDSDLFSESTKYCDSEEVIRMCNLEKFKDISCIALIDEHDDEYQEVVVVASPHKEDYDELLRSMILRYQSLKEEYKDKYDEELKTAEDISIRQEYGVVSFIISKNVLKVLNVIRSSR